MEKIIVISELIRGELRSRTEAKKIYAKVLSLDSKSIVIFNIVYHFILFPPTPF